ncbi:outer membrane protein OmpK [Shewanella sp.]|uniref:nucleoside-specific channel-forming Tsx family protein n=1 Tax=Shewanella sp. TaxID=50422 RepID=UPI003F34C9F8
MKNVKTLALAATAVAALSGNAVAADRGQDIHAGDYNWMQFNYMYAMNELPGESDHDYIEMEFGGRSGIVDLYGYLDIFNPTERSGSDKAGSPKMFLKLAPRFSLDAITGKDLSWGPVQEVYLTTLFNWGGGDANLYGPGAGDVNNASVGIGADVMVPWFGKVSMNLYKYYEIQAKDWNGYQFSMNWFKPFINFDNGSFISYQGYLDYQFGADSEFNGATGKATHGGAMFNGIYWHSEQFALGYGLKAYSDVYLIADSDGFKSTGVAHYFSATYKF